MDRRGGRRLPRKKTIRLKRKARRDKRLTDWERYTKAKYEYRRKLTAAKRRWVHKLNEMITTSDARRLFKSSQASHTRRKVLMPAIVDIDHSTGEHVVTTTDKEKAHVLVHAFAKLPPGPRSFAAGRITNTTVGMLCHFSAAMTFKSSNGNIFFSTRRPRALLE